MCTCPLRAYLVAGPTPANLAVPLTRNHPTWGAVPRLAAQLSNRQKISFLYGQKPVNAFMPSRLFAVPVE